MVQPDPFHYIHLKLFSLFGVVALPSMLIEIIGLCYVEHAIDAMLKRVNQAHGRFTETAKNL